MSAELELDMLAEIAYTSFVDDQLFFSKERLVDQIRDFLIENLNAPRHLDSEIILREIEIQQGILVERARDAYSFSHLTFQEYLTAKHIVDNYKIYQLAQHHMLEQSWREVFLLVSGLTPGKQGADELLLAIEHHSNTYTASSKIMSLITWATIITMNSPGKDKAAAKRIAAILLVFDLVFALSSAIDLACGLAHALGLDITAIHAAASTFAKIRDFNSAYILVNEYEKIGVFPVSLTDSISADLDQLKREIPNSQLSPGVRKIFRTRFIQCFFGNLRLEIESVRLATQEARQVADYFYALELIVRCKEAAVRVSPQVWAGIESRMVTVPTE